jgi:GNAT superfamily N-acetyltransferase
VTHQAGRGAQVRGHNKVSVSNSSLDVPTALSDIDNEEMIMKKSCNNTLNKYAPTILNLVVSPSHQRLGLASRLLSFAQKYTRAKLRRQDLGLYVRIIPLSICIQAKVLKSLPRLMKVCCT